MTTTAASTVFVTDEHCWYNNGIWGHLGYALPAVGDDPRTINAGIAYLVDVMGRNLAAIMQQPDVDLRRPPEWSTLVKLDKLIKRARTIIAGRTVPSNESKMPAGHVSPAPQDHIIYPVPYFRVRNRWLKEYCGLTMSAISEAIQHTDNRQPHDFGVNFAQSVSRYLQRIYRFMATELFLVPKEEAEKDDFVLTDEILKSYSPERFFTETEMVDRVPPIIYIPTEDDLGVLTDGIPATMIVGGQRWPSGGAGTASSTAESQGAAPGAATPPFPGTPGP